MKGLQWNTRTGFFKEPCGCPAYRSSLDKKTRLDFAADDLKTLAPKVIASKALHYALLSTALHAPSRAQLSSGDQPGTKCAPKVRLWRY